MNPCISRVERYMFKLTVEDLCRTWQN